MAGLFIVSTPIGNLKDITFRAIETLKEVEAIVCEDTRVSSKLLQEYGISKPLIVLNDFNEENELPRIISLLNENKQVALISDAGTPLVSDPGFKLVQYAIKKGYSITSIPGPSAPISALTVSGFPPDKFLFLGFLPKSKEKKKKSFTEIYKLQSKLNPTVICFETPQRIVETLEVIQEVYGDIHIAVARELTKMFEEVKRDNVSNLVEYFNQSKPKGEFVVLFKSA